MSVKHYTSPEPTTAPGYFVPAGEVFAFASVIETTDEDGKAVKSKRTPSDKWTEVKPADAAAMSASQERVPDDANLEAASKGALQAVAIMKHVDIRELKSKEDLITAIKASYEPKL